MQIDKGNRRRLSFSGFENARSDLPVLVCKQIGSGTC